MGFNCFNFVYFSFFLQIIGAVGAMLSARPELHFLLSLLPCQVIIVTVPVIAF